MGSLFVMTSFILSLNSSYCVFVCRIQRVVSCPILPSCDYPELEHVVMLFSEEIM